jgi:hypothetical protein
MNDRDLHRIRRQRSTQQDFSANCYRDQEIGNLTEGFIHSVSESGERLPETRCSEVEEASHLEWHLPP